MDSPHKKTAEIFDRFKDLYAEAVNDAVAFSGFTGDFFTRVKADYLLDLVVAHFGATTAALSVLDVGCGVGNYHPLLTDHFHRLHGIDVSLACLEKARTQNSGVEYLSFDGHHFPYPDASFDLALCICVLHHVPPSSWRNFLEEMRRVIKAGGLAIVFEHNPRNPLTMRAVNSCEFDQDAVLLRAETSTNLMKNAGFSEVESSFILTVPSKGKVIRQFDKLFGKWPWGAQYYVKGVK